MHGREPIEFLVLGPLEVRVDGRSIPLGGAKQRAVLGVLLLHADEVVPNNLIVDGVWGEEPPPSAAHTIEGYVSRLRRAIEPHGPSFVRQGGGYRLDLAGAQLDARAARDLLRAVIAASEAGDHERAAALAGKALAVWRGPALRDAPLHGAARAKVDELDELRLRVGERLADADLALGRHEDAAALLRPLVDEHPYRERLVAQLMLALYRAGRPAEALDVYERTRQALADDLGLKPGAELQRLSGEIVRHDPRLTPPPTAADTAPVPEGTTAAAVGRARAAHEDGRTVETTSATATFLFTDIEGSTELLKSHRGDYGSILADHQRLLREAFTAYGGTEVDSQGDSFFIAFRRAKDAILAAAACQRALAEHTWPGGASLGVRMGIHTGEADRTVDRFVGLSVHRAARISAVGHGGQVLVSQTTASLVEDDEDDLAGIALEDLGEHRLKDIARPVRLYQLEIDGLRRTFPPLQVTRPPGPNRRKRAALMAVGVLLAGLTAVALALASRDGAPPPEVLPSSVVRIDPDTLQPTQVVRVGNHADLVVVAGGYVWVTHRVLRYTHGGLRNAGDRTLTRVDPSTGEALPVGGLAPCGLAADPSGDVWVANCFASRSGPSANVVRVDAKTLDFETTWRVRAHTGFFKGMTYGGGSLWVADAFGEVVHRGVTRIDPRTGVKRSIPLDRPAVALAWSEGYGDLWMTDPDDLSVSRLDPESGRVTPYESVATNPGPIVVQGDGVWVGDWTSPQVVRVPAIGSGSPRHVVLPTNARPAGVTAVAAGAGSVWATAPDTRALWRIDPKTNHATPIPMRYYPWGVAVGDDGVWVTVRGEDVDAS